MHKSAPPHNHPSGNNNLVLHSTTMLRNTTPLDDSCKLTELPVELVDHIFQSAERTDLLNVMLTCKSLSRAAERALWKVSDTKNYLKLREMDVEAQSKFMSWVRVQSLVFDTNGLQPGDLTLCLPRLQELVIDHQSQAIVHMKASVSPLITGKLTILRVLNGRTDNFVPALAKAKGLKHLVINRKVDVQGGNLLDLQRLVADSPSLVTLHAGDFSSAELFIQVASHGGMKDFKVDVHMSYGTVSRALQIPEAFASLRRLGLNTPASAAGQLLPRLTSLESLELVVSRVLLSGETPASAVTNLFLAIGKISKLQELRLSISGFQIPVQQGMLEPFANLTHLSKLSFKQDFEMSFPTRGTDAFLPLSLICPLEDLHLEFRERIPADWIRDLGRKYPKLKTLSLGRYVKMTELSDLFPALEEISFLSPDVSCTRSDM
jgi:hypothetical protein